MLTGIDDKGIGGIEIESCQTWQSVAACREIERELLKNGTFTLEQMPVLQSRLEGCQDDVVGVIMSIGGIDDGIVVDAVVPNGIGTDVGTAGGGKNTVGESNHLGTLVVNVVLIEVFQCEGAILAGRKPFDDEVPSAVGTRDAFEGLGAEDGIGKSLEGV